MTILSTNMYVSVGISYIKSSYSFNEDCGVGIREWSDEASNISHD